MGGRILEYEAKDILRRGIAKGRVEGEAKGETRFARLTKFLLKEKRYDDLERATADPQFKDHLYQEYGLKPA